jgi:hypothetical protein
MIFKNLNSYYNATATYDSASKKLYVIVDGIQPWVFSKGDIVTMIGHVAFFAKIEELEKDSNSNTTIMRLTTSDSFWVGVHSGLRQQNILIKTLPMNKSIVKPYIEVDLYFLNVAEKLAEFKLAIASGAGLTFNQALAGLEPYSQITSNFDAGNPPIVFETFVADKVKAKLYKKGGNQLVEISDGSQQKGTIYSGGAAPLQDQIALYSYLDNMRYELREQGEDPFTHYNLSLVDNTGLNVVLDGQSVKTVRRTRKDGKIKYALEIASGQFSIEFASGLVPPFTLTIEKSTVKKNDYLDWNGSGIMPANQWLTNQEDYQSFNYSKKHGIGGHVFFELKNYPITGVFLNRIASLTVDDTTIYGDLILSEDNNVMLVKPDNYADLAWAAKTADVPADGLGFMTLLPIATTGKPKTIQLKVYFANIDSALNVYKRFQNAQQLIVAEASATIGALKVTEVEGASQVNSVDVLTATATLAARTVKWTVKWFNAENCLQITVAPNSTDAFSVCKSNGVQEKFSEILATDFLDAAAYDIKKEHENNLEQILNLSAREQKIDLEIFLRSTDDDVDGFDGGFLYQFPLGNAEVTQSASGTTYNFYSKAGGVIPQFKLRGGTIIQFVKTAEQNVDGSKFVEKFVEDIAVQYDDGVYGLWYLKDDTTIKSNEKLTIRAGQQLRFNRFGTNNSPTFTNKGTIILDEGNRSISSGALVVDPTTFINDGTILNSGFIYLSNGMTNNGAITNNAVIVNRGGTFTNNGSITNNATFIVKRNGVSFVGNDVVGTPISYEDN